MVRSEDNRISECDCNYNYEYNSCYKRLASFQVSELLYEFSQIIYASVAGLMETFSGETTWGFPKYRAFRKAANYMHRLRMNQRQTVYLEIHV